MWITPFIVSLFALPLFQSGSPSDVRLPPTILVGPKKKFAYYRSDDPFKLECKAYGVPEVSYEWKKNEKDLNLNGYNVKRENDGTITISPATSLDAGFYQCIASNQYGKALSNTSFMQLALLDSKGNAQVTKIVTEGEPFCIEAHPTKSIPKAKPSWQTAVSNVDDKPEKYTLSKRVQVAENGDLCFAYAKTEDDLGGKIYKISEFNEQIDRAAGGSYTKVTVNRVAGGPKQFAPTLSFSSQNQTVVVEGQDVTLYCFFAGNPEPQLEWAFPRNSRQAGRYLYSPETYNSRVTIQNIQPSDDGNCTCTAKNEIGTIQHTMRLIVEAAPRFLSIDDQPHDTNVTEGSSFTFKCNTYAKPEATVVWLRNGELLNLNLLPRYRVSGDKKLLTIVKVCRDCIDRPESSQSDLGVIQCNASNKHGYAFGAGYVNVLLKTRVEVVGEKDVSVDMNEEKEFMWECKATSDPSTPPRVKWSKETEDGYMPVDEEPPALLLKDGTLKIHVVPNKKNHSWQKYQGTFRCDGGNDYTNESVYVVLRIKKFIAPDPAGIDWWIFLLIVLAALLLLIIICICCCCLHRNKGDTYDVDEKERKNGHDPEKELLNDGFQDYQRPEEKNRRGSRGSLGSVGKMYIEEEASLMEYGDDPGKFTEDGSFVGAYASNTVDRNRGRRE